MDETTPSVQVVFPPAAHKERHVFLHQALDELLADFIRHTENHLTDTTLIEFMNWSYEQTQNPTA